MSLSRQRLKRVMNGKPRNSSAFMVCILLVLAKSANLYVAAFISPTTQRSLHFRSYSHEEKIRSKLNNNFLKGKKSDNSESNNEGDDEKKQNAMNQNKSQKSKKKGKPKKKKPPKNSGNILSLLSNPYNAGKKLRQTLDSVLGPGLSPRQRSIYYLDDRFLESESDASSGGNPSQGALGFLERSPLFDRDDGDDYIPEVLVVGATGAIGRLVVRRMVLSGRFRVRVLVRDLYSNTLNLLGTGVTYCQGDLRDMESLEYAVTDVDKIVFCAGPPRTDEDDFGAKFRDFVQENLSESDEEEEQDEKELDFQRLSDTMELRARLAEQVDDLGMQNVVRAYQNVRHADYGTSQAAKRSLFKFQDREEDFGLFAINIDEGPDDGLRPASSSAGEGDLTDTLKRLNTSGTAGAAINSQVTWMKNQFKHGVFTGRLPVARNGVGDEASIISNRLRSREDPNKGTDLSNGFAGFVCRICADGKTYEAFIRTSDYETKGVEYVCKFDTTTKPSKDGNKSLNKFQTIRLPFSKFKPVIRRRIFSTESTSSSTKAFTGNDVKQIGFRVNSADNILPDSDPNKKRYKWLNFYIALCYIKVYRSQPEAEFVYLSDARIPANVKSGMVRHDLKRILSGENEDEFALFNEEEAKRVLENPKDRSGEELYYKYRGEEILKNSGLQYCIMRVPSLNELPSGEFSTIQLKESNDDLTAVSRAEVAAVCVSALLDPNAKNASFYITKAKPGSKIMDVDESITSQFLNLKPEK